jgi:calcium/calmodulin-dependent protein kinase I
MVTINTKTNIFDSYVLCESIGEGMTGKVYKTIHKQSGLNYAVKVICKHAMDEDELIAIHTEISILSEVNHPNIVQLFEAYETDEKLYLVMELMQGGELFDRIVELECFTEFEAKEILLLIIDAVDYCHQHDIIHRDLKPENILYESSDEDSVMKISDFGLARFMPDSGFATTACGSPCYVAPERLSIKGYGKEVDVWSVGIIMYILL